MSTALFDPAQAGREITHTYVEYVAAHKVVVDHTQQRDAIKGKLIEQLRAAHGHVADFKAFLKEYVQIPRSTAYKLLAIADGRGEEIRQQEREAKQRQRARVHDTEVMDTPKSPALIPDPPTPAEVVELAASQGVTMTKPEVAECLRLASLPEGDFENEVEAAAIVPAPAADDSPVTPSTAPIIGKSLLDMTVREVAALGLENYKAARSMTFADDVDLDLYDTAGRAFNALNNIYERMAEPLDEPLAAREKAESVRRAAEAKAQREAAEAARVARIKWEVDHPDTARTRYYDEALAGAKAGRSNFLTDEDEFDQVAFDAAYKADLGGGRLSYSSPQYDFYKRWHKEHNAIFPHHREASLPERKKPRHVPKPEVNVDHIDIEKARKLLDAFLDKRDDPEGHHTARCALAAFLKIKKPTFPPRWDCDYSIDPIDAGRDEREAAYADWEEANAEYLAAEEAVNDKLWRIDNPEEAAEHDKECAERDAEMKKRLQAEAKSPDKTKAKALKEAQRDAMEGEMESAKEDAKDSGERWGDQKDQWVEDWLADNWGDEQVAEAEQEFLDQWERQHGKAFPASNYGSAS
jgi:hypothetical protein